MRLPFVALLLLALQSTAHAASLEAERHAEGLHVIGGGVFLGSAVLAGIGTYGLVTMRTLNESVERRCDERPDSCRIERIKHNVGALFMGTLGMLGGLVVYRVGD